MAVDLQTLRAFVKQCDPATPLGGEDPRYVQLSDVRGEGDISSVDLLAQNIKLLDSSCQLFTGYPGTGKTTELRRLEKRLEEAQDLPTHVVYVAFETSISTHPFPSQTCCACWRTSWTVRRPELKARTPTW